ncbi:hypothetical protein BHM03_00007861 [Ensete ventricosum]|uniref:Uncharacterized protein n=1 Tax=Ensete ventricosum TaxID=4639 RepID=A0A445MC57_ENSVE|nr:hypothetical protein BHM03_00007861 [Ensete ventricosum]
MLYPFPKIRIMGEIVHGEDVGEAGEEVFVVAALVFLVRRQRRLQLTPPVASDTAALILLVVVVADAAKAARGRCLRLYLRLCLHLAVPRKPAPHARPAVSQRLPACILEREMNSLAAYMAKKETIEEESMNTRTSKDPNLNVRSESKWDFWEIQKGKKGGGFGDLEVAGAEDPPHWTGVEVEVVAGGGGRRRRELRRKRRRGIKDVGKVVAKGQGVGAAAAVEVIRGGGGRIRRRGGRERGEATIGVGEESVGSRGGAEDRGEEAGIPVGGGRRGGGGSGGEEGMEHGVRWVRAEEADGMGFHFNGALGGVHPTMTRVG